MIFPHYINDIIVNTVNWARVHMYVLTQDYVLTTEKKYVRHNAWFVYEKYILLRIFTVKMKCSKIM